MTETHSGRRASLEKFLSPYMQKENAGLVCIEGIEVPHEAIEGIDRDDFHESFVIGRVGGSEDDIENLLVALIDKFYGALGFECTHKDPHKGCMYVLKGEESPSVKICIVYTIMAGSGQVFITANDLR